MFWLAVLLPNLLWPFILGKVFKWKIHWQESVVHIGATVLVGVALLSISKVGATSDVEVVNGRVTSKDVVTTHCTHTYPCNPYQSCDSEGYCTTKYRTCHKHSQDFYWRINTTIGRFTVPNIDEQGVKTPPRWEKAEKGDPVSSTEVYRNPIKGAPQSMFNHEYQGSVIYPSRTYDLYHVDRVRNLGIDIPTKEWNEALQSALSLSPRGNVVLTLVPHTRREEVYKSVNAWIGGKRNDLLVFIGVRGKEIAWAEVHGLTTQETLKLSFRDDILALKVLDKEGVMGLVEKYGPQIQPRDMRDFEYLLSEWEPSKWALAICSLLLFLLNILLTYFFHKRGVKKLL